VIVNAILKRGDNGDRDRRRDAVLIEQDIGVTCSATIGCNKVIPWRATLFIPGPGKVYVKLPCRANGRRDTITLIWSVAEAPLLSVALSWKT